jgi:hypothetical protein
MIEVTLKDLLDFAKTKNPEDEVNMSQTGSNDSCGCLMVQYGREKFPEQAASEHGFGCGCKEWESDDLTFTTFAELECCIDSFGLKLSAIYTYAEVVEILEKELGIKN